MKFSSYYLDQIKDQVKLAQVVGARVRLKRKGHEYVGLCPFHSEKTPSFTVNENKGFYHCFGCGEHGSVFDFLMKIDNLTFPESVEWLAKEIGIELPAANPEETNRRNDYQKHYDLLEEVCQYYERQLNKAGGESARRYLLRRGIDAETTTLFRLGFASDEGGHFVNELIKKGFDENLLGKSGVLVHPENSLRKPYPRFRNRVIFPIKDLKGRVIGFGGRRIGQEGGPKYLNSPETLLFHKGRNLYGLEKAFKSAQQSGQMIVTEGYTDVISLHQLGFDTAVAPLGTAITEDQIRLIWRYVREPIFCFDGDSAGQRAAIRVAEKVLPELRPGYSVKFAMLSEGNDPDKFIRTHGVDAMNQVLKNAVSLSDVVWSIEVEGYKLDTPEERSWLEDRIGERVKGITNAVVRRHYQNDFNARLWKLLRNVRKNSKNGGIDVSGQSTNFTLRQLGINAKVNSKKLGEAILVFTLIAHPGLFDQVGESLGTVAFSDPDLDKLRQEVLKTLTSFEVTGGEIESKALERHLVDSGFSHILTGTIRREVLSHATFSRSEQSLADARSGWEQQFRIFMREQMLAEIDATKERLKKDLNRNDFELLKALKNSVAEIEESDRPLEIQAQDESKSRTVG